MRIDHTGINEIIKQHTGIGTKGSDIVGTREEIPSSMGTEAQPEAERMSLGHGIMATTVEKALFSLESELDRIKQDAGAMDFDLIRTQMAVLSNTLQGEDAKRLQEEGYSLNDTQVETIVTVMDKIKMELAKSGMDISVFGDDLSMDQLEAMAPTAAQAKQMASDLRQCEEGEIAYLVENELEPTIENLYWAQHSGSIGKNSRPAILTEDEGFRRQVEQVIKQAGLPVNETTLGYGALLLENQIPLTPENIAYAGRLGCLSLPLDEERVDQAISQAVSEGRQPQEAYLMEGYSMAERAKEAERVIAQADEETLAFVAASEKPFTIENLGQAEQEKDALHGEASVREAPISKKGNPKTAQSDLSDTEDKKYVTARRQLEEIRLIMTSQANYRLLKKGISIETLELGQLVEELKGLEADYYQAMLKGQGVDPTPEHVALLQEATEKTEGLKWMPSYLLGSHRLQTATLEQMYESGRGLKASLEQASEAYETMRTEVRPDMGDSIQKAFRNVDDILESLELEPTQANRRAVRILAYNELEITPERIDEMKAADEKMQNLFMNMKPAVVVEMIREGIHPLQMDIETLNQKAKEIADRLDPGQEEAYSKYLWKLEQNQAITPEEKESYIGIYRLLRQIEKTDGEVIGAVMNQGGELSLKNLLTAVRSRAGRGMDAKIDETFGMAETVTPKNPSISRQIEAAYQTDCAKEALGQLTPEGLEQSVSAGEWQEMTPEQLLWQLKKQQNAAAGSGNQRNITSSTDWAKQPDEVQAEQWEGQRAERWEELEAGYHRQQVELFQSNQKAEEAVLQLLNDYDLPVDTWHIMAAGQFINNRNSIFRNLFDKEQLKESPNLQEAKEILLKEFGEAVKTPEDMAKAQLVLAETAEHVMEGMINEEEISSQDVRDLKILRTQIQIGGAMGREENYAIPVLIADEMTNVQLKIVRGQKTRGMVDILFETERLGKVAARFTVSEGRTEGFLVSDREEALEQLRQKEEHLKEQLAGEEKKELRFDYLKQENLNLSEFTKGLKSGNGRKDQKEYQVQTKELYTIAKQFIETVKQAV